MFEQRNHTEQRDHNMLSLILSQSYHSLVAD